MSSYDAVIVGAGHNGLTCAAYLARAGLGVVVVERSEMVGGACVTEELFDGYRMSTAAYSLSLLQPQIIADLGLKLDVRRRDPVAFAPYEGGGGLFLWGDQARRTASIAELSRKDAAAYGELYELFGEAAQRLRPLLSYPATRKQVKRALAASEMPELFERTIEGSIASLCEEYFEHEFMQGYIASQGITGTTGGPRTEGTAYVFLHHALGEAAGASGAWGFVRGGMGTITEQLAHAVRAAGGEIRLSCEVDHIRLDVERRASGVVLSTGEEIVATIVCSGADPKRTVALAPAEAWSPEFVEDVALLPSNGPVVKVNCALSGLPGFSGVGHRGENGPEHLGMIVVAPSIDYLEAACKAAAEGSPADPMFVEAWIQTATEPELAPEGKHTLSIFAQYAPYQLAEGTWEERRDEIGDIVIATLERYAPGLSEIIEHRLVLGPPDLEARFGLTGGNIFHGEILPDWLFERRPADGWHRHRTPLPGLYLCGSGAHPGGGVTGAPGRNAARAVLEDRVAGGLSSAGG
ncbi:MAG: NAD(P)/FAD-dependent oxidoreductase [Actinomycetota bacterium]|nr:NAD(P)/FAD-dependent oxidoreductase [Actinomycetota bacterium]